ncbi:MAG: phosphoglycerate kinase [bacterium]|nr:phosphoglycerate kinase [bacterium]
MKSIRDAAVEGKRVLVRCDFNVPLDEQGNIEDDFRIRAVLPTLRFLLSNGAKLVLISHLDEPNGESLERMSLGGIGKRLEQLLGISVRQTASCIGKEVDATMSSLSKGEALLLENIRFCQEEEANDTEFAKDLSRLGDLYVNEAFSVCHRAHASVVGIPKFLPSYAGLLLEKEVAALSKIIKDPERPFTVLVGGSKVETKGAFIDAISEVADLVLLGNLLSTAQGGKKFKHEEKIVRPVDGIPGNGQEFDIGPETIALFAKHIKEAKTLLWSGPMGKVEEKEYEEGSFAVAQAILESGAYSVAGGGDTVAFLRGHNLAEKFSHVSTGGGAMLAFLANEKLPGLEALGYYNGN